MKDALGWVEAELEEEILRDNFSLIIGKVVCTEINDAFAEDGKLVEMPALMLSREYRLMGDRVLGDVTESIRLFQPNFRE